MANHRSTDDLTKLHWIACVFLVRLLIVAGTDAPNVLRQIADESRSLEAERMSEEVGQGPGAADRLWG